jgi:hypothetical protein
VAVNPAVGATVLSLERAVVVEGRVRNARGEPVANAQIELHARDHEGNVTWLTGATVAFREALFGAQVQGPRALVPSGELGVMPGRVPLIPLIPVPAGISADRAAPGFTTNLDGTFRIEDVPPGMVTVTVTHPSYVRTETEAQLVRAGEHAALAVTLQRGGTIDGRVVTERGFPLRTLQIEVRSSADPIPRRVFSQGDGSFRVPAVRGRVALVAFMGARVVARSEVFVADEAMVPVTMTVPGTTRTVSGRVVDGRGFPVEGATVSITAIESSALGSATTLTRTDGSFSTLVGGTRAINLDVRHPEFAPRGVRVDDPSTALRVELSRGASLEFEVRSDGCLTHEARVELRSTCGPVRSVASEGASTVLEHLCAGRASLVIDATGCMRIERTIMLPAAGVARVGHVALAGGGGADGEVVDGRGDPVSGAVIARADAPPDALTGTTRSDRLGHFSVANLPEGDTAIVAWHPTLGRTQPAVVRVIRGTIARGMRLRFERDFGNATRALAVRQVLFEDLRTAEGTRVEVRAVGTGTAPERAGLRAGDHVVSINASPVASAADAERRLVGVPGDDVVMELERDGVRRTVRYAREH